MFDFFGTIAEALSGYIAGRYRTSQRATFHLTAFLLALSCGLVFFVVFGVYELIDPASNPIGNVWLGLFLFSLGISLLTYLFLFIDYCIKRNKKDNENQK